MILMRPHEFEQKSDLLVVHQGALGDFVVTFPTLLTLKRRYRQIHAICQSKLGKLGESLNIIEKSFPSEGAVFASLYTNFVDARVQDMLRRYHTVILFSHSKQIQQAIKKCIGDHVYRIAPQPAPNQRLHVGEHILSGITSIGLLPKSTRLEHIVARAPCMEDQRTTDYDSSRIYIHPGSGGSLKNWPLPNFKNVFEMLRSEGMKPRFILGPAEEKLVEELCYSYEGTQTVSDLVVLSGKLKTAGGFIGNDSGITHLAAFLGLPTVAVFGPSDSLRWRPIGASVRVVAPDTDCAPCFETNQKCDKMDCFNGISPQKVFDAFYEIYR
jgi:ADP-heptose:LPS heptosyltransferase